MSKAAWSWGGQQIEFEAVQAEVNEDYWVTIQGNIEVRAMEAAATVVRTKRVRTRARIHDEDEAGETAGTNAMARG
jgi:lipopolysaccharide export system protein LptA